MLRTPYILASLLSLEAILFPIIMKRIYYIQKVLPLTQVQLHFRQTAGKGIDDHQRFQPDLLPVRLLHELRAQGKQKETQVSPLPPQN